MKLIYQKNHPNGFKVFLASKLSGTPIELESTTASVRHGAQFHYIDSQNMSRKLDPNSAVLRLFQREADFAVLQWIDWERRLQDYLSPYLVGISTSKGSDDVTNGLSDFLKELDSFIKNSSQYLFGAVCEADVILYSSLLPLLASSKSSKFLENYSQLFSYMNFLRYQTIFKEAEIDYYGSKGVSLEPWVQTIPSSSTSSSCTLWSLLKLEPSGTGTVQSSEKSNEESSTVSESEISAATKAWDQTPKTPKTLPTSRDSTPILPVKGQRNILVTSALPYVNNVPHLGNIIGCVLSADCFSRFCRLRRDNIIYICGTDEYGTATETKALSEGITPKEICDRYHAIHSSVYKWFNISFDFFGRTTTSSQTVAAQSIFNDLQKNNNISQNRVEQLYCTKCERFLADRFVEGTCPQPGCRYDDARGDQCDACGKLVNATDLINPRCKLCSQTPTMKASHHLFIDLPKIEPALKTWITSTSNQWSHNAKVICETWIRDGLRERCITRDLKWGTPVPLEGFTDKVFYVWFDAPIGYISMTMEYTDKWEQWWKNPDDVSLYQFMAKDNVPFHGVIFPCSLLGTHDTWTKVTHLISTEYLNYEDGKFSKSRGVGVFGDQAQDTGIPSDVWRFYLLYVRPESQDTTFSWSDLQFKNNNELLNNLGNFINRSLKFVYQFYKGIVPPSTPNASDFKVMARVNQELDKYTKALSSCKLRDGIRCILSISRIGNQYIQDNEPYKLIKPDRSDLDKQRGGTVINIALNIVALVASLLQPYMPDTSKKVLDVLCNPATCGFLPDQFTQFVKPGHQILEPSPLITKITDDQIEALRQKFAGSSDTASKAPPKPSAVVPVISQNGDVPLTPKDPQEIERLEKLVAEQGNKVRELKSQSIAKDILSTEINLLLKFKDELSLAQGIDPASQKTQKKKGKKK